MVKDNMRKEFITDDELTAEVRTKKISDLDEVAEAYTESGGRVSVILRR